MPQLAVSERTCHQRAHDHVREETDSGPQLTALACSAIERGSPVDTDALAAALHRGGCGEAPSMQ